MDSVGPNRRKPHFYLDAPLLFDLEVVAQMHPAPCSMTACLRDIIVLQRLHHPTLVTPLVDPSVMHADGEIASNPTTFRINPHPAGRPIGDACDPKGPRALQGPHA